VHAFHETDTIYVGLSRGGKGLIHMPASHEELRAGDVLLIEADKETLETFLQKTEFELAGSKDFSSQVVARVQHPEEQPVEPKMSERAHMDIQEVVVRSNSRLAGRSVREVNLRSRFGVNLLAAARQGERVLALLKDVRFKPGDILLVQGDADTMTDAMVRLGCVPLFPRPVSLGAPRGAFLAGGDFHHRHPAHQPGAAPGADRPHHGGPGHDPYPHHPHTGDLHQRGVAGDRAAGGHDAPGRGPGSHRRGGHRGPGPAFRWARACPPWSPWPCSSWSP
jgi:uncharacterized protein with PhoU and TrkA domain